MNVGTVAQSQIGSEASPAITQLLAGIPVREQRIDAAGISTTVLTGGKGQPLVLLHGQGEYAAKFFRVLPALLQDFHVVAPDMPGHGTTVVGNGAVDTPRVMKWLDELIRKTCAEPPVLVGQITGGSIAASFASEHPQSIRQLVLVDSLGLAPFEPAPDFGQALMSFVMQPNQATHEALWEGCSYDLSKLRANLGDRWPVIESYNIDRAKVPELQTIQQTLMQQFGFPPLPEATLAAIKVPTTLIWGRHDRATPLAVAQAASKRYGWPLHVIEEANDDPTMDQPDAFVAVLREVIS